jgi:hypothetical protein
MAQRRPGASEGASLARIAADIRQVRRLRETAQSAWTLGLKGAAEWMVQLADTIETQALADLQRIVPEWDANLRIRPGHGEP